MKTILNFAKGALGLVVLAAFVLVLVGLFGPLSQRVPVGQEAYPIVTVTPTAPPLPVTPTPQPYPPPQTPTVLPPATPTTVPTPPIVTPPVPITSTLEIIWAESTRITTEVGPNQPGIITFWRANIADLASRMSLVTMPQGYSLKNASLSPDGNKIAFTTLPPPPNSRWWLLGTLWVMNVDGSGLRELAQGIDPGGRLGPYPLWSPDSRRLAYLKQIDKQLLPSETPTVPPPPYRYEIYSASADGTDTRLLVSDDTAAGIYLFGWSSDGTSVYYMRSTPGRGRELWAMEAVGGKASQLKAFMDIEPRSPRLSPDASKLIFNTSEGLVLLSTDGRERRIISPLFGGIWSLDSTEIIGGSTGSQIEALNVNTGAIRVILTDQQMFAQQISSVDELLSVSPDGRWLAMKSHETGELYLSEVNSTVRIQIPGPKILHDSYFVGWISP
jgi:hypothetical protein